MDDKEGFWRRLPEGLGGGGIMARSVLGGATCWRARPPGVGGGMRLRGWGSPEEICTGGGVREGSREAERRGGVYRSFASHSGPDGGFVWRRRAVVTDEGVV